MTAEALVRDPGTADSALTGEGAPPPKGSIGSALIERILARTAAGLGLGFAAQALPVAIGQIEATHHPLLFLFLAPVVGSLLFAVLAAIAGRGVRVANAAVAVILLAALIAWPLLASNPGIPPGTDPWLLYLVTVATGSATIAWRVRLAAVYTGVVPAVYILVRMSPAGGGAHIGVALLDATYVTILGFTILICVTMLRSAARTVDAAQLAALDRYTGAVRLHAREVEKVQVDAIVHDSALATLLSAARARTPEAQALAATMARLAIDNLHDAESGYHADSAVPAAELANRVRQAAELVPARFAIRGPHLDARTVPFVVFEALCAATVQAMSNSAQHASPDGRSVRRTLTLQPLGEEGLQVVIEDDGAGFDADRVAGERLGVRVSILERVRNAGGTADIVSSPNAGTRVVLSWQPPSPPANLTAEIRGGANDVDRLPLKVWGRG